MIYFNRNQLLKSLKRIKKKLELIKEVDYFKEMLTILSIDNNDIDNTEVNYTDDIIEDIFVLWYESGICKDFSTEISLLIKVDNMLDMLDIDRMEFNAYITKQEKLIPKKV